jgi:hypothetical protein
MVFIRHYLIPSLTLSSPANHQSISISDSAYIECTKLRTHKICPKFNVLYVSMYNYINNYNNNYIKLK